MEPGISQPALSDIDLRLLRVFRGVVRHNGFSAAQDDLGLTQATISIHMSQLEERLGMRLCERGRGGFYLTDYGKLIYEATLNLFRSIENFHGIIESTRGELFGDLHFGTVDATYTNPDFNIALALGQFSRSAPKVVIHIDIASPQALLQGLLDERYHVIFTPIMRFPKAIRNVGLLSERQSLYCGRDHPLFETPDPAMSRDMLGQYAFVGRSYMLDGEPSGETDFHWGAVTSHMESTALLILSGNFIGYLPTHFALQWEQAGRMRRLLDEKLSYDDYFHVAYRRQERNSAARSFIDCILKSNAGESP